ncbi:xanthine dehydrogenase accessory protein XdhC [Pokkaliibacter sp. CJK22405]|uniref:xanthine dehydrogenase accessory protein XdhC n=1 Tax=Pokkaliibacter sp. CJK22405 TaxID=3384615 RepID=UPI003984AE53
MQPSLDWISALSRCKDENIPGVLVTVLGVQGSSPRDAGTKMLITEHEQHDTIGGGNLEYQCLLKAREFLQSGQHSPVIERFNLAASLGMCCGGVVMVLFEPLQLAQPIVIFGAGHVASALVSILKALPYDIRWVDERDGIFAEESTAASVGRVRYMQEDPLQVAVSAPAQARFLILTHDHQLDFDICLQLLKRESMPAFVGLIGSSEKWRRFQQRFEARGITEERVSQIHCPLGMPIGGKRPMEVAVSIAAQQIQLDQTASAYTADVTPLNWQAARALQA